MQKVKLNSFISQEISFFWWAFHKGHKPLHFSNEPKFLVNVIFCGQPPNSMTPVARKAMIVARYPAAVMWLVKDSYWLMWDTEIHTLMWQSDWHEIHTLKCRDLIGVSNIPLYSLTKSYFFFMEKKKLKNHLKIGIYYYQHSLKVMMNFWGNIPLVG